MRPLSSSNVLPMNDVPDHPVGTFRTSVVTDLPTSPQSHRPCRVSLRSHPGHTPLSVFTTKLRYKIYFNYVLLTFYRYSFLYNFKTSFSQPPGLQGKTGSETPVRPATACDQRLPERGTISGGTESHHLWARRHVDVLV